MVQFPTKYTVQYLDLEMIQKLKGKILQEFKEG